MVLGGVEVFTMSVGAPSIFDLEELLVTPLFGVFLEDGVPPDGMLLLVFHLLYGFIVAVSSPLD